VLETWELEVYGVVDPVELRKKLQDGVLAGPAGFETKRFAGLVEAGLVPGCALQDPRSRIVLKVREPISRLYPALHRCGHQVCRVESPDQPIAKRIGVGPITLDRLDVGGLLAAKDEEEAWALELSGTSHSPEEDKQSSSLDLLEVDSDARIVALTKLATIFSQGSNLEDLWRNHFNDVDENFLVRTKKHFGEAIDYSVRSQSPALLMNYLTDVIPMSGLAEAVRLSSEATPELASDFSRFTSSSEDGDVWANSEALASFLCHAWYKDHQKVDALVVSVAERLDDALAEEIMKEQQREQQAA
jgi:hypothetical protein